MLRTLRVSALLAASLIANAAFAQTAPSPAPVAPAPAAPPSAAAPAPAAPPSAAAPAPAARREPTPGDLATARAALKDGLALRDANDLPGALARLTTAFDIVQTPITGFELGKTHMMMGKVLTAHEMFRRVERMPQAIEETSRSTAAREEAARLARDLEPRIPSLRIKLVLPPEATAVVRLDDDAIPTSGAVTPRAVDPGTHEVIAKAGDGPEVKLQVDVAEGETKDVELAPQWIPPKVPEPNVGEPKQVVIVRQTNPMVFVGFGVSSAALVLTSFSGYMAVAAANRARDECSENFCPSSADRDKRAIATWLVVGGVSAATAIGFFVVGVLASNRPVNERVTAGVRPTVGLGTVGLEGRF